MSKTRIVLTIDGGGIRGVIPAVFLQKLEQQLNIKLVNYLDLIVGTSTGGILTAGMVSKNEADNWKYNFDEIIDFYLKDGKKIFYESEQRYGKSTNFIKNITKGLKKIYYFIKDLFDDERYSSQPIDEVFKQRFGDNVLLDANEIPAIMLTGFDFKANNAVLLKSHNNKFNLKLWEAVRITASAPTYFEPYCVNDMILVDGGLFANDPSLSAYVEIKKLFPKDDFIIISLGTGMNKNKFNCNEVKDWNDMTWLKPLISSLMDGPNSATNHYLSVLEKIDPKFKKYFRIQVDMNDFHGNMDDASEEGLKQLVKYGEKMFDENKDKVDELNIYINNNEDILNRISLSKKIKNLNAQ